jgi:two-component system chemotaxis response regulator CheY
LAIAFNRRRFSAAATDAVLREVKTMGVRVMIVEDDTVTRTVLHQRLARIGCHVVAAVDNASAALKSFREYKPDLVTLDIEMPEVDGLDSVALFRQIRREDVNCEILIISGTGFPSHREMFVREGALGFFYKPVNFDRLAIELRTFFPEITYDRPSHAM